MDNQTVFVTINGTTTVLPSYEVEGSSGMDVRACIDQDIVLNRFDRVCIPTGLRMSVPLGYEIQVRPRSGLAAKYGVTVLNTPGTVDHGYTGEIKVILINFGVDPFMVRNGERIAQLVLCKVSKAFLVVTDKLQKTIRGEGGFGSTGI